MEPQKDYPADVVHGTFFEHNVQLSWTFVDYRTNPNGYARPLRPHRVNKLVAEWDQQAVGVLLLSMRKDGRMAIIDGQHRVEAARRMGLTTLDALVYIDLSIEDEARLYRKFGDYLRQSALDRFHAGLTEGLAVNHQINDILIHQGLHIPSALNVTQGSVVAVDTLLEVHRTYGAETLRQALSLLYDAWKVEPRAYRSQVIMGTAAFLARFATHANFNRKQLVARLIREGITNIERRAMSIREGSMANNGFAAWGQALLATHDHRLREGKELGEWVKRHITETQSQAAAARMRKLNASTTPEQRTAMAARGALTKQTTRLTLTSQPCPTCHAGIDEPCHSSSGRIRKAVHPKRRALKGKPKS